MKILATHLYNFMEYAAVRGIDWETMLKVFKGSPPVLKKESAEIELDDYYAVIRIIQELLDDEFMGIRAGQWLNLKALGLIYHISLECATIEEALFYLKGYLNSTFPIIKLNTDISESHTTIYITIRNERRHLNRFILESLLTLMAREIKIMTGDRTRVSLFSPFHTPEYPENWSQGDSYYLRFKSVHLQSAIKDKSRLHLNILVPEYLKLIEMLKTDTSIVSRVKIACLNLATPELPSLEDVADSFNLTERTLQRRLHAENTSYRQIIGELKQKISKMLLRHSNYSVTDISYTLGYSEPAAFIHSFKKWYGDTPRKVRMELVQG